MNALLILSLVALASAEPPSGYSTLSRDSFSTPPQQSTQYGVPQEQTQESQTFKNVYVYSAPDEPTDAQSRVIRVPGGDKHVNIIFVKTPSQDSQQQTEVILPEQDEHKNLVYVLLKKGENNADVKIRRPEARQQPKPEVNFIRYSDSQQQQQQQYGAPAPAPAPTPVRVPSNVYGAHF